jgi:hypothetical protein
MERSPVHELVDALWRALHELGSPATTPDIERWAFSIHGALSAHGREYHNHDHVIEIASAGDPLEVIAALYHDAVYIQVDHDAPRSMKAELDGVLATAPDGWRILPAAAEVECSDVLVVFGVKVGDVIKPTTGLNEVASALVASVQLAHALDRAQRIAVAACIEQTIPFRLDPVTPLHQRIGTLGLPDAQVDEIMRRAVRVGNRDVENFADNDAARFLDNTWKLLPESNPALHAPSVYTVRDYRVALQKMEGFLAWLPAEQVFHFFADEPKPEVHARRVARTTGNLELAVRYLRAKLYSISLVEAIAAITGGDVPLEYFMGGAAVASDAKRLEQFLPHFSSRRDLDPPLHRLLAQGRTSESSFDTKPSPIGAFLHASVGEATMMDGIDMAKKWWAGAITPAEYLASQPPKPIAAIARAAANIVDTRRDRLFALAERLES